VLYVLIAVVLVIFGLGVLMGRIFFIRKSPNDLLKEQNELLRQILARSPESTFALEQGRSGVVPTQTAPEAPAPEPMVFEEDTPIFVPKVSKATKTDVSNLETQQSEFDNSEVEKLRSSMQKKADV